MPIRVLRFSDDLLADSVETHVIEGVSVKVFGVAKTVADCFRHRGKIGLAVALEGLQEALRQRKATPAEIARAAETGGVGTVIRPYLEALTANGQGDQTYRRLGARPAAPPLQGERTELRHGANALCARSEDTRVGKE